MAFYSDDYDLMYGDDDQVCPECDGLGWVAGHDPDRCDVGGPKCADGCPVQLPCPRCTPSGLPSPDDEPF